MVITSYIADKSRIVLREEWCYDRQFGNSRDTSEASKGPPGPLFLERHRIGASRNRGAIFTTKTGLNQRP